MSGIIYTNSRSKAKVKRKPGWQKEQAEYEAWLRKHGVEPGKKKAKASIVTNPVVVSGVYRRETPNYPSLNSGGGSCAAVPKKVYTGDKIVGIAAMHKSNLVPIFNDEAAKDVASMRR